jgi:hypothetical protein
VTSTPPSSLATPQAPSGNPVDTPASALRSRRNVPFLILISGNARRIDRALEAKIGAGWIT